MSEIIAFEQVSKRFLLQHNQGVTLQERAVSALQRRPRGKDFWAVRDVSFAVEAGQSFGLVGHNGAGKSTILKLMTRILEPTSGQVRTRGRIAALLELGSGFHPELTGRENVFLYGSLMGLSRRDMQARLEEIVAFADIGPFIDTEIKHYSSGMYTRLAFAAATAVDPDILITDEVLAVGDEAFQRKCMDRIYGFRKEGKTIIFVSHALEVVRSLCDTAIWLDHGTPRGYGQAGKVIDAYLNDVNAQERERLEAERGTPAPVDEPQESFRRRGTHELEIVRVQLLDGAGEERGSFSSHDPLVIRMHYMAHQAIERPVFGVGIYHQSGIWLSGPNTGFSQFTIPQVAGPGFVDYCIESLPLLTGRYDISVAAVDESQLYTYDLHDRAYTLTVHSESGRDPYGIVAMPGSWKWQG